MLKSGFKWAGLIVGGVLLVALSLYLCGCFGSGSTSVPDSELTLPDPYTGASELRRRRRLMLDLGWVSKAVFTFVGGYYIWDWIWGSPDAAIQDAPLPAVNPSPLRPAAGPRNSGYKKPRRQQKPYPLISPTSYPTLLANARAFWQKLPGKENMLGDIASNLLTDPYNVWNQPKTRRALVENCKATRPLIHFKALELLRRWLQIKSREPLSLYTHVYNGFSVIDLLNRLFTKRPICFYTDRDTYLLRNDNNGLNGSQGRPGYNDDNDAPHGNGQFDNIHNHGVNSELNLQNYISYEEMCLSSLMGISSPTQVWNDGNRRNAGAVQANSTHAQSAVYVAQVGCRFERKKARLNAFLTMVDLNILDGDEGEATYKRNGFTIRVQQAFRKFYKPFQVKNTPVIAAVRQADPTKSFKPDVFKQRYVQIAEAFLLEAQNRGKNKGQDVYAVVTGIGLGVWANDLGEVLNTAVCCDWPELKNGKCTRCKRDYKHIKIFLHGIFFEAFLETIKRLQESGAINNVRCVEFNWHELLEYFEYGAKKGWFNHWGKKRNDNQSECCDNPWPDATAKYCKNPHYKKHLYVAPWTGIDKFSKWFMIKSSGRNAIEVNFTKDGGIYRDGKPLGTLGRRYNHCLIVANYAWDGNSYPGNEVWLGHKAASADPAAVCATNIGLSQNPEINKEYVSGAAAWVVDPRPGRGGMFPITDPQYNAKAAVV